MKHGFVAIALVLFACPTLACGDETPGGSAPSVGLDASSPDAPAPRDGSAPPDAAADAGADAPVAAALLHYLGRFDTRDPAGPRFAWPGSAIAAAFIGTGISVTLTDSGSNYIDVAIDGMSTRIPTTGATATYPLATGLTSGAHTVAIGKSTESNVGVVQFLGFSVEGGDLTPSPEPFARRIEFIGDSISCGYGDLGAGPSCPFTPATEDEAVAYDAVAAHDLHAQARVIAYSGIGAYRDYGGSTADQMPVRFLRTLADDPSSTWGFATPPPDVVVVHLGTNDYAQGDPGPPFVQAYVALLQEVRARYSDARIVCALSPMLGDPARSQARTAIESAVTTMTQAGDARVSFLEFDEQQQADGYGCDWHPSTQTHLKMAQKLIPAVKALTGW
jgi:hypothetical protein